MASPTKNVAVAIDGEVYELESSTTASITLVHRLTGKRRVVTPAELATLVTSEETRAPRLLDILPKPILQAAAMLAADIDEVLTGVGRNNKRRPDYDLATTSQEQRVIRKLEELSDAGRGMSRSTFFTKMKAYQRDGLIGLVDGRALRDYGPLDRIDEKVVNVLIAVIDEQPQQSTHTIAYVIQQATTRLLSQHGAVKIPSRATLYRAIEALGYDKHLKGSAKTRASLAGRPDLTFTKNEQLLPGSQVHVDTNLMDIEVQTPDGRARPHLTVMLDVYSRTIMAYTIRLTATKGVDHALLLAQAVTPRQNRPSRESLRDTLRRRGPGIRLLTEAQYVEHAHAHPHIYPRSITTDHGRDYKSTTFRAAAQQMGCSIVLSPPYTPTAKSHVERLFGSINSLFTQALPGYIGRSPDHRGKPTPTEKLLTVEALRELFEDWVVSVWQNRPHSGLRDRLHPSRRLTPNQKAAQAALTVAQMPVVLSREDYIRMLPSEFRVIGRTGFKYDNRQYDSTDLHPLRGTPSGQQRHGGKWEVKVDPYNPTCVWVVDRDNKLIECHERGAEDRLYEPDFGPVDDYRDLTARSDAEIAGTPFPEPERLPISLPSYTAADDFLNDDDITDIF